MFLSSSFRSPCSVARLPLQERLVVAIKVCHVVVEDDHLIGMVGGVPLGLLGVDADNIELGPEEKK